MCINTLNIYSKECCKQKYIHYIILVCLNESNKNNELETDILHEIIENIYHGTQYYTFNIFLSSYLDIVHMTVVFYLQQLRDQLDQI